MSDKRVADFTELDLEEAIAKVRCAANKEIKAIQCAANQSIRNVSCAARKTMEELAASQDNS